MNRAVYRSLNATLILDTIRQLERRVCDRFPDSGLSKVATDLHDAGHHAVATIATIERPFLLLRVACGSAIVVAVATLLLALSGMRLSPGEWTWIAAIPTLESFINGFILLAAGALFLITLESRIKRRRALKAIHELRALAHIIDMHQLTKDPAGILEGSPPTPASPTRVLTPYQLTRYLDYCTEMLSLIGKLAALHVQHFEDPVTLAAVDGIEDLTNGLSRRIWQKIAIIEAGERAKLHLATVSNTP